MRFALNWSGTYSNRYSPLFFCGSSCTTPYNFGQPLKRPVTFEAEWELRFGPDNIFRVFYEINIESHEVYILAIGVKEGNRLLIGGKEVKL
jgi:hypothetical protein